MAWPPSGPFLLARVRWPTALGAGRQASGYNQRHLERRGRDGRRQASGRNSYNDFVIFGGPVSVAFPAPPPPPAAGPQGLAVTVSGAPGRFAGEPVGSLLQPGPGIG